jgi:hypothetical protein
MTPTVEVVRSPFIPCPDGMGTMDRQRLVDSVRSGDRSAGLVQRVNSHTPELDGGLWR